jgi:peptidoglycan/LPS O-acetylase OafA/YrhL
VSTKLSYRPDIDGLRALAVLGVLFFHAKVTGFSGGFVGVDVFFVISGYLITSILIRELDATGHIDFVNFWARRTRRLLPSALLVIIVTLIASYYILSTPEFYYAVRDSIWAAIYLINWTKLISAVEYFDEGGEVGPFLHYWSLAVEEQFYIYLTLVFFVALALKRWFRYLFFRPITQTVIWLIVASGVFSFAANLYYISDAQPIAFFGTHSRIWQLALGAGVGLIERGGWAPGRLLRGGAAWGGLAAMLLSYVIFDAEFAYPGLYALLPSLGTALFILAGINAAQTLPLPLRTSGTFVAVAVGKISYSLYLWHWPVFVLWRSHLDRWEMIDIVGALTLTFVLSIAGYFAVEKPIRFSQWLGLRPIRSVVGAAALSLVFVVVGLQIERTSTGQNIIILASGNIVQHESLRQDLPSIYRMEPSCHLSEVDTQYPDCVFGSADLDRKMFLFGDSHAAQWFPALEQFTARNGYRLFSRTKSACASIDIRQWHTRWKREYTECVEWRNKVLEEIEQVRPDIVVIGNSSRHAPIGDDGERLNGEARENDLIAAERRMIDRIRATGAEIVFMEETPWHGFDPPDCLVSNPRDEEACRTPIKEARSKRSPWSVTPRSSVPGIHVVDLTDQFCWDGYCYSTDGEFALHRDKHHVSLGYAEHLADTLASRLNKVLGNDLLPKN